MRAYRRFTECWPDLEDWFAAPLPVRLGFAGPGLNAAGRGPGHQAAGYLVYLSLVRGIALDYEFLLGRRFARPFHPSAGGRGLGVSLDLLERHRDRMVELGYPRERAWHTLHWGFGRLVLHRADPDLNAVTSADLLELGAAVRAFGARDDFTELRQLMFGNDPGRVAPTMALGCVRGQLARLHAVHVLLFNTGQVSQPPLPGTQHAASWADELMPGPGAAAVRLTAERYLRLRLDAGLDRPQTVRLARAALRRFTGWLTSQHPEITSFAGVTRTVIEEYLQWLPGQISARTGTPLRVSTVKHEINNIAAFFRDTAIWGWSDVPGHPLLTGRDAPRTPESLPRFLPRHELGQLMNAVAALPDPMQRAALLVARWSGARRDEIRRLALDCLDAYPDGHPRLRIPVGKGHAERMIPLHPDAAAALGEAITLARAQKAIARHDPSAGRAVRHVFIRRGQLLSAAFLFDHPLRAACTAAGLTDEHGIPAVSAHRFRHTVGTQLAEGGARIQTIMAILGHKSAGMSLIYSRLSDPEIRRQYEQALAAGGRIAGPAATALLDGHLDDQAVHWLQASFLKTELELGHCLRLPAEGPCECDLVLNCPKFLTTSEYAPRLRARLHREDELIADARERGWQREIERHQATRHRIQQLLTELGEPGQTLNPRHQPRHATNPPAAELDTEYPFCRVHIIDGDEQATETLLSCLDRGWPVEHAAERIRQDRADRAERDRLRASLEAAGVPVTDRLPQDGAAWLSDLTDDGQELTPETHASCPGHGAALADWNPPDPVYYCTSPDAHGHASRWAAPAVTGTSGDTTTTTDKSDSTTGADPGPAGGSGPGPAPDPGRRLVIEGNKAWQAAAQVRHRWLASSLLARRSLPRDAHAFAVRQLLAMPGPLASGLTAAGRDPLFARLAGHDPDHLEAECGTAPAGRLTVIMLAPVITAYEHAMTDGEGKNTWRTDRYSPCPRADAGTYLAFLAGLGYRLSGIEQAVADGTPWTGDTPPESLLTGPDDNRQLAGSEPPASPDSPAGLDSADSPCSEDSPDAGPDGSDAEAAA
jgi:integrase